MGWVFKTRREELMGLGDKQVVHKGKGNFGRRGPATPAQRSFGNIQVGRIEFSPGLRPDMPSRRDPQPMQAGSAFKAIEERVAVLEEIATKQAEILEGFADRLRALEAPAKARAIKFERRPR
jgi:hypothetical protein